MSKTPIRDLLYESRRFTSTAKFMEVFDTEITSLENRLDAEYITEYLIHQQMREAMEAVAKWVVEHDWGGDWPTMRSVIDKYLAKHPAPPSVDAVDKWVSADKSGVLGKPTREQIERLRKSNKRNMRRGKHD